MWLNLQKLYPLRNVDSSAWRERASLIPRRRTPAPDAVATDRLHGNARKKND